MKYDLIVLSYPRDYLPIFTELEPRVRSIAPCWQNPKELLRFLLQSNLRDQGLWPQSPTCYLFFRPWYPLFASGYLKKVKKSFPSTKACWFFSDLVSSYPKIDIQKMKDEFDLILSFDPEDAATYGFTYCPLPYSIIPEAKKWEPAVVNNHLSFIGQAKERLDLIFGVYEHLKRADLRCDFHIANALLTLRRFPTEINYSVFLPYAYCLEKALSSQCILEILQDPDHHGYTARTAEALVYGRKLVSNNTHLKKAFFYNPKQIHVFSDPKEINPNFLTCQWRPTPQPASFSPRNTLQLIENRLNINLNNGFIL